MTCPKSKDGKHFWEHDFTLLCKCGESITIADIEAQARKEATLKLLDELEEWVDQYNEDEDMDSGSIQNWIAAKRKKIGGTD